MAFKPLGEKKIAETFRLLDLDTEEKRRRFVDMGRFSDPDKKVVVWFIAEGGTKPTLSEEKEAKAVE